MACGAVAMAAYRPLIGSSFCRASASSSSSFGGKIPLQTGSCPTPYIKG